VAIGYLRVIGSGRGRSRTIAYWMTEAESDLPLIQNPFEAIGEAEVGEVGGL